jgi:hypothetical protein
MSMLLQIVKAPSLPVLQRSQNEFSETNAVRHLTDRRTVSSLSLVPVRHFLILEKSAQSVFSRD